MERYMSEVVLKKIKRFDRLGLRCGTTSCKLLKSESHMTGCGRNLKCEGKLDCKS